MGADNKNYRLYSFVDNDRDVADIVNVTRLRNRLIVSMDQGLRYSDLSFNGRITVLREHFPGLSYDAMKNIMGERPEVEEPLPSSSE